MKTMENQKKKYNQVILDGENGSSIPLVFTTEHRNKKNIDHSIYCYVKSKILAKVILVHGLKDK